MSSLRLYVLIGDRANVSPSEVRLQARGRLLLIDRAARRASETLPPGCDNNRKTLGLGKKIFATAKRLSSGLRLATILLTAVVLYAAVLKKSGRNLAIFAVSLSAIVSLTATTAIAQTPRKQIFTRGTTIAQSTILGLSGQPAYVVSARGTNTGILLKDVNGTGIGASLGLSAGDVLLSINDRVVQTAQDADRILSVTPSSNVRVSFVKASENGLQLYNAQLRYTNQSARSEGGAGAGTVGMTFNTAQLAANMAASIPQVESFMVEVINHDRAQVGAAPVSENNKLKAFARSRSQDMATRGYFGHVDPDGVDPQEKAKQAGIEKGVWENISCRTPYRTLADTVVACQRSMMSEPSGEENHRSNILNPQHKTVGVGLAINSKGLIYMTQEFSNGNPGSSHENHP